MLIGWRLSMNRWAATRRWRGGLILSGVALMRVADMSFGVFLAVLGAAFLHRCGTR